MIVFVLSDELSILKIREIIDIEFFVEKLIKFRDGKMIEILVCFVCFME